MRFITPRQWLDRDAVMREIGEELAAEGEVPRLIPAGASDRLGMFAFEDALHELLGVDEVEVPAGLSARVLAAVRADRRRRRLRPVGVLLAAAAAAVLAVTGAGWWPVNGLSEGPGRSLGNGLGAPELPSEELLAALPLLESLEFLEGELDPLEQEVLLVRDPSDALILEFLELGG